MILDEETIEYSNNLNLVSRNNSIWQDYIYMLEIQSKYVLFREIIES